MNSLLKTIPEGLYYILYDSVIESGDGTSFHSVLIYKNSFIGGSDETMFDCIVGEWCGRLEDLKIIMI